MAKKIDLSLIIPAFNEEKRLPKRFPNAYEFLTKKFKNLEIILVDDGSSDNTVKILEKLAQKYPKLKFISYSQNRGKGFAVKKGVEIATGKVIGFTDADFAVDLDGVIEAYQKIENGADIVIGDRNSDQSKLTNNPNVNRRLLGKFLGFLNQIFLPLGDINDSQNGFKFFKKDIAKDLFKNLTIGRWLFDIQLLSLAKTRKYKIVQQSVLWQEVGESKVVILKDLPKVGFDLLKLYCQFMTVRFFTLLTSLILILILLPFLINPTQLTKRNGDFSDLVWPDYYFIKQSILNNHQIPLWNPTLFSGIPELANPQSPLIYPPNILALILPIDLAIVILFFIHALVGGIYFFKLTKQRLKWSILSSVVSSFIFVFSPFFWTKIAVGHLSQIFAIFLTAPILYFGFSFWQTKRKKYIFLTIIVLALQYLNYPTIWYFTNLFGLMFLIGFVITKEWKNNFWFIMAPILSLVFIAPIFLLQLQAGPLITRSILSLNDLAIPLWSFSRFIKSVLIPSNFLFDNETEVWLYPSVVGLILAGLGFRYLNRKLKLIVGLLLITVILITLGGRTPIFGLLTKYFPGFSYLRVSTRDWFIFITIISFLAGYGLEKIPNKFRKIAFGFLVFDLIFFSAIRIWFVPNFMQPNNSINLSSLFQPSTEYRTYCTNRCLSAEDSLPAGLLTADGYHLLILQSYRLAVSDAGGFAPPEYTGNLPTYSVADAQPSAQKLGRMAVKWVISPHSLNDPNFVLQKNDQGYSLYENKLAEKRFYFPNFSDNKIQVLKDTPNQIILETEGVSAKLVIADSYYPDWEAFIDSKSVKIEKEDGWARSFQVAEGRHLIEMRFNPLNHIFSK